NSVPTIAGTSAIIMAVGFLVNVLLARVTPLKYIFLTGHMMWISSVLVAYFLYSAGYSEVMIVVLGSIIQGAFLTL
ncbi:MAG TPA: PTS ascorbate transporter subunit IIC, partial [Firmicutes bacterium]|nr:PTS ascorbate transporter subunit IIC [Bacillota bacterium]